MASQDVVNDSNGVGATVDWATDRIWFRFRGGPVYIHVVLRTKKGFEVPEIRIGG